MPERPGEGERRYRAEHQEGEGTAGAGGSSILGQVKDGSVGRAVSQEGEK